MTATSQGTGGSLSPKWALLLLNDPHFIFFFLAVFAADIGEILFSELAADLIGV